MLLLIMNLGILFVSFDTLMLLILQLFNPFLLFLIFVFKVFIALNQMLNIILNLIVFIFEFYKTFNLGKFDVGLGCVGG